MKPRIAQIKHIRLVIDGLVQGVGFRPFVHRLATQMNLQGRVWNSPVGVNIDLVASDTDIQLFKHALYHSAPEHARIDRITQESIAESLEIQGFSIQTSDSKWFASDIPSDRALCERCSQELTGHEGRHHGYPFNSCSECGPRFSIIQSMPYDRSKTAMVNFALCKTCEDEFNSPENRRFNTEAISCNQCGPELQLLDSCAKPHRYAGTDAIISECVELLSKGSILALKGIGGFHLCCDALNQSAINQLRQRKNRPLKPFAIMMRDIQQVEEYFTLTAMEKEQLCSAAAPIVLLAKTQTKKILPKGLAPNVSCIGVMLAYSPLHLLALRCFGRPLLMTSGNRSGEPLCTQDFAATQVLKGIVDAWLVHNRPILNRCDDSIVKIIRGVPRFLRRARGFIPSGISIKRPNTTQKIILSMGADLKNTFGITLEDRVVLSGHNGDLAEPNCFTQTAKEISEFEKLFNVTPDVVVVDKHPDYFSSQLGRKIAAENNLPIIEIQHHHAHFAACLADNQIQPESPILGVILDGAGFGDDNTIWGGELLLADYQHFKRVGGLKPFPLLGGEKASLQPWRNALILLHQAGILTDPKVTDVLMSKVAGYDHEQAQALILNQNLFPLTSSAGRLFDAVSALLGIAPALQSFEGEAAMRLESMATETISAVPPCELPSCVFSLTTKDSLIKLDPKPFLIMLIGKLNQGVDRALLAEWFHRSFIDSWVALIKQVANESRYSSRQIALSGGVFQNSLILAGMQQRLETEGYVVYSHIQVPSNDGGIALGQSAIASQQLESILCV